MSETQMTDEQILKSLGKTVASFFAITVAMAICVVFFTQ